MTSSPLSKMSVVQVLIRPVQLNDCDDLWQWRNDPITRANSLSTNIVEYSQHKKWFDAVLDDPNQFLMLGELVKESSLEQPVKIGMIRFDVVPAKVDNTVTRENANERKAIVSINLNPEYRGKGLSVPLLCNAIASFKQEVRSFSAYASLRLIEATIKEENIASIKCFERAGFEAVSNLTRPRQTSSGEHSQIKFVLILS